MTTKPRSHAPMVPITLLVALGAADVGCGPAPAALPVEACPSVSVADALQPHAGQETPVLPGWTGQLPTGAVKANLPSGNAERDALRRAPLWVPTLAPDDPLRQHGEVLIGASGSGVDEAELVTLLSRSHFELRVLANSWLVEARDGPPERAAAKLQLAAELGRLLVLRSADYRQQAGLEILAEVARLDPGSLAFLDLDVPQADLASELEAQGEAVGAARGRSVELYCRLAERLSSSWARVLEHGWRARPSLTAEEVSWLVGTARCGPWRAMRLSALRALWGLSLLGDREQRRPARRWLERLALDADPAVASEAARLLDDANVEPCVELLGG